MSANIISAIHPDDSCKPGNIYLLLKNKTFLVGSLVLDANHILIHYQPLQPLNFRK